jgi:murein DD-endopeptidase MepM/ murein hydrolase activator NlpD
MRLFVPILVASVVAAGAAAYGIQYQRKRAAPPDVVEHTAELARPPNDPAIADAGMVLPIAGLKAAEIQDTYYQSRGGERIHEATDILAPRGTPVRAMVDGVIQKLFLSKPGGNTIYEFDLAGVMCYYYAHLDHYAEGLNEGQGVHAGDVIGYVGTTGNADPNTPHLHLAFLKLNAEKQWWKGTPENPYPTLMRLVREGEN